MRDILLWLLVLFCFSFFIFPYHLGDEIFFSIEAKTDVTDTNHSKDNAYYADSWSYMYSGVAGVVDWNLKSWIEKKIDNGAASSHFYIIEDNGQWIIKDWEDRKVGSFLKQGRPFFYDSSSPYVFFIDDSGKFIKRLNLDNWIINSYVYPGVVTAFTAPSDNVVSAVVGGDVYWDTPSNSYKITVSNTGESIVYGLALSDDYKYLALVEGFKKQYVRVYSITEGKPKEIWNTVLSGVLKRPVYITVSNGRVVVEEKNGMLIKNINTNEEIRFDIKSLLRFYNVESLKLDFVVSQENNSMVLSAIKNNKVLFSSVLSDLRVIPGYKENKFMFFSKKGFFLIAIKKTGDRI
ncbi:hypothetical protein WKV44_09045 [Spirochaetia bacterium 38H-sp]|uniref:Uncharacterized protein n=1 Tax=Rarispira pelagica TaxID=3141764 RepID=A0ABU9UDE5_9SPIR